MQIWLGPSKNLYLILKSLFKFSLEQIFSQPVAKFIGLFALLIYVLGIFQWAIIKLPKNGRNSGFLMIRELNLIQKLETISANFPKRILKLEGYLLRHNSKENLEIIIFRDLVALQLIKLK